MNLKLAYRFEEIARRSLWAIVSMAALATMFFLLAPVFASDADRLPALLEARSMLLSSLGVGALVTFLVSMFAIPVQSVADRLKKISNGKWVGGMTDIPRRAFIVVLWTVPSLAIAFGLINALFLFLHAPSTSELRVTHLDAIDIQASSMIGAGLYSFSHPNARVVGDYLAIKDNVIKIALPVQAVFAEPLGRVDDIETGKDTLFVIAGHDLLAVTKSVVTRIAELPLPGMRFGRRVYHGGVLPELLLSGNDGARGRVYELYPDGTYAKLADTDANIVGAAGCMETTVVAYAEQVVQLRPGYHPRFLFRLPQSSGPITSIAARMAKGGGESADCLWLVATRSGVYSIQDGAATLLIAGMGGNLSVSGKRMSFQLTDPQRNGSIKAMFKE